MRRNRQKQSNLVFHLNATTIVCCNSCVVEDARQDIICSGSLSLILFTRAANVEKRDRQAFGHICPSSDLLFLAGLVYLINFCHFDQMDVLSPGRPEEGCMCPKS